MPFPKILQEGMNKMLLPFKVTIKNLLPPVRVTVAKQLIDKTWLKANRGSQTLRCKPTSQ